MISVTNEIHCSFVMSKSRVAPQRLRTISRLELSAAVLGVQLCKFVQREMDLPINTVFFWTDSTARDVYFRISNQIEFESQIIRNQFLILVIQNDIS